MKKTHDFWKSFEEGKNNLFVINIGSRSTAHFRVKIFYNLCWNMFTINFKYGI